VKSIKLNEKLFFCYTNLFLREIFRSNPIAKPFYDANSITALLRTLFYAAHHSIRSCFFTHSLFVSKKRNFQEVSKLYKNKMEKEKTDQLPFASHHCQRNYKRLRFSFILSARCETLYLFASKFVRFFPK
jgi:hypothetical protein